MYCSARQIRHYYEDPLSIIWINCAQRLGFRVERSAEVFASCDGKGTLLIATDEQFDADDNLAQMIFHELCHALVEGEAGERALDWGLDNTRSGNSWREHACLRLQAWLADRAGLRDFMAPTTDFRMTFWMSLPADPFEVAPGSGGRRERSCVAARMGAWRASQPRWALPLQEALLATARLAETVHAIRPVAYDSTRDAACSLWDTVTPAPQGHPAGHAPIAHYHSGATCKDCAWSYDWRNQLRCRHAPGTRLPAETSACTRFEPAGTLDCTTCGACCREAYHSVEVSSRDPVNRIHPEMVIIRDTHRKLRRNGNRCHALSGGHTPTEDYRCDIYEHRPRTCRDFFRGSENCLDARRRVGLSL